MSELDGPKVPKRGDAAWKAVKEGVAERNEQTKKDAKKVREAHLQNADSLRRAAGVKRQARVRPGPDAR